MNIQIRAKANKILAVCLLIFATAGASPVFANGGGGVSNSLPSQQTQQNIDPAQSYQDGLAALDAEDYKLAEDKFGEVLSVIRKHPEANYFMGIAKIGRGKIKSSRRYFERAVKERPGFIEAREKLALVYVETGKPEKAQEQLTALQEFLAGCAASACTQTQTEMLNSAIAAIETALESGETGLSAALMQSGEHAALFSRPREEGAGQYLAAVKLINQSRYDEAIDSLYQAQKIVGPHSDILNYLGFAHRKINKFDQAKSYYAQALALDPNHLGANEYLGELYLELGNLERAKKQLARLDALCSFGCAAREDLARLIDIKETTRNADAENQNGDFH